MLAQKDADTTGAAEVSTYQGMKRWLEGYERIASVSDELHRGVVAPAAVPGAAATPTKSREEREERRDRDRDWSRGWDRTSGRDWETARRAGWRDRERSPRPVVAAALEAVSEEERSEEHLCNLTESCAAASATPLLPTFDAVTNMARALHEINICPSSLAVVAEEDPEAFLSVLEEGIEMCAEVHGVENGLTAAHAVHDLAIEMLNNITTESLVHPDIEVNDTLITKKQMPDGTFRESSKPLRGTIKELVRGLRTTIPVFKLLQADNKVREYLLYCALSLVAAMGQPIAVPTGTAVREMTLGDWLERGRHLAGMTPHRFTLPPDSVMDMLAARIGRTQMVVDPQQAAVPPGMSQSST